MGQCYVCCKIKMNGQNKSLARDFTFTNQITYKRKLHIKSVRKKKKKPAIYSSRTNVHSVGLWQCSGFMTSLYKVSFIKVTDKSVLHEFI